MKGGGSAFCFLLVAVLLSAVFAFQVRPGTYMPLNEANRGKNLDKIVTFTTQIENIRRKGGDVNFIVGFSTGHVGTTTLTSKSAYNAQEVAEKNVKFVFERAGVPPSTCADREWDIRQEVQHVEYYYGPEILSNISASSSSVIVDLSHANICFYRGLIHVFHLAKVQFKFIRVRRERIETALSMSIQDDSAVDFFARDYYRYHPFEATHQVHLRIPGGNKTWSNFTSVQRIFWVIDETQARWEALLAHHPDLPYASIYWSKEKDNLGAGVSVVAKTLGVHAGKKAPPTTKVHAGDKSASDTLRAKAVKLDMEYRQVMGFNSTEPELTGFTNQHLVVAHHSKKYLFDERHGRHHKGAGSENQSPDKSNRDLSSSL
jgi:hypothetical protein